MDIINTTDTIRMINATLTPFSLILSMGMLFYSLRAWHNARVKKNTNEVVGISLLGVSLVFLLEAVILSIIYYIIYTSGDRQLVNFVVNVGFFITNLLTIATSFVILGIYRDKI